MIHIKSNPASNSATIEWTPETEALVRALLNPRPVEISQRAKSIPWSTLSTLTAFLRSQGAEVSVEEEADNKIANMNQWASRISATCKDHSEPSFMRFMKKLGIEFRDTQVAAIWNMHRFYFNILAALCGMGKTLCILTHAQLLKTLYGKVLIPDGERETILVPRSAVVEKGQLTGVYVVDESGVVNYRLIKKGAIYDNGAEILSGLKNGERIIVTGTERAVDGGILRDR